MDRFQARGGADYWTPIVEGNKGSNRSGDPAQFFGVGVFPDATWERSLQTYATPTVAYWKEGTYNNPEGSTTIHFVDVQDDRTTREDRIIIKLQGPMGHDIWNFDLIFCDDDGTKHTISQELPCGAFEPNSEAIYQPSEMVGHPFKGSVSVRSDRSFNGGLQGTIERIAPGKWRDVDIHSPAGAHSPTRVAYVNSTDANWKYQIDLFYPEAIHSGVLYLDPPTGIIGGDRNVNPPPTSDALVILRFYDMQGIYRGWAGVVMGPNTTRRIDINDVATRFIGPFEGSVSIEPAVVAALELESEAGKAHGSAHVWRANDY